jgi:hypothetical protein
MAEQSGQLKVSYPALIPTPTSARRRGRRWGGWGGEYPDGVIDADSIQD